MRLPLPEFEQEVMDVVGLLDQRHVAHRVDLACFRSLTCPRNEIKREYKLDESEGWMRLVVSV